MRAPRSLSKSSSANTRTHNAVAQQQQQQRTEANSKIIGGRPAASSQLSSSSSSATAVTAANERVKRGVSLVMNREQSFTSIKNDSTENLTESVCSGNGIGGSNNHSSGSSGGKKTVKYVFRHKPKESQVV
jgi:hypothetical protein